MSNLRIVSLLPSATEIVCALGLQESLVGVSHCCDFPSSVSKLPVVTTSIVPAGLSSREIDDCVSSALREGRSLYELDVPLVEELRPDVVITQELCDVCAVDFQTAARVLARLKSPPVLVSLQPNDINDILEDVQHVGEATGKSTEAGRFVADARERLAQLKDKVAGRERPRVAALEWFDPLFSGGHWVPEQIVAAGGIPLLGHAKERSVRKPWSALLAEDPDAIFLMPCGYNVQDTVKLSAALEVREEFQQLRAVRQNKVWALDANSYFSRPSPRVVQGAILLGHILHPDLIDCPPELEAAFQRKEPNVLIS